MGRAVKRGERFMVTSRCVVPRRYFFSFAIVDDDDDDDDDKYLALRSCLITSTNMFAVHLTRDFPLMD
jgi:hypothetical protein